jgi:hypothetical protein
MFGLDEPEVVSRLNIAVPDSLRERYMDALGSQKRARGAGSRTFNLDKAVDKVFIKQLEQDGVWINNNTGDGYFLMRRVSMDHEGLIPVLNKDGKQVELLWSEVESIQTFISVQVSPTETVLRRK